VESNLSAPRRIRARLDGMANASEPTINLVIKDRLKVLISLDQKVSGRVAPLAYGNTRTKEPPGNNRGP